MKIPMLLGSARAAQQSQAREGFQIALLARTQNERLLGLRWQPVFDSSGRLE